MNPFDFDRIVKTYNIDKRVLNTALRFISKETLKNIYDTYCRSFPEILKTRDKILNEVYDLVDYKTAHSIRSRVKDPEHLIEKIIRNIAKKPRKYKEINENNYHKIITDLIGIRIMILGREPWIIVHNTLEELFINDETLYIEEDSFLENYAEKPQKAYIAEKPTLYLIRSDSGYYEKSGIFHKFTKKSSDQGYRSVHYTIRTTSEFYCEIQVRTVFEEGWLEFDHLIKYPYDQGNQMKNDLLNMLATMAKLSDDVIIYYNNHLCQRSSEDKETEQRYNESSELKNDPPISRDGRPFKERLFEYILTK